MTSLQLSLLGPVRITRDGVPIPSITSPKTLALLAYLAVEDQRSHNRESLAELLWPGQMTGRQNLRQSLSRLHKALALSAEEEPIIHSTRSGVAFNHALDQQVDVHLFTAALRAVRAHEHPSPLPCPACAQRLQAATALYRGDLLADVFAESAPFDEWLLVRRAWLQQEALWALDVLTQYALEQADSQQALTWAQRQIAIDPLREEAHQQVIQALLLDGRRREAQVHYDQLVDLLRRELDVTPASATTALVGRLRQPGLPMQTQFQVPSRSVAHRARTHNLPHQFTPFVGREDALALVQERLSENACRLLSLVGPGGMGKTRLAVEAARRQLAAYADGVCFLDLAPLDGADQILPVLSSALGLTLPTHAQHESERQDALIHLLTDKELLLILDNYEHLLPHTELVTALLQGTSGLRLLVTSRSPLHLRAEWLIDVEGLSVPPEETPPAQVTAERFAAVALFEQTASRVKHDFAPSDRERRALAHICRLVQGAPLALELAAARVRELSVEAVADAIAQDLDFLSTAMADVPPRHRSLRAVIDHSWRLLPTEQQAVFARLSVFRGGFTWEAARHIAGASTAHLEQLALHSLLRPMDQERYALHESLRQYTAEKLAATPSIQREIQRRHASYYLGLLASQEGQLFGQDVPGALATLRPDYSNLRMAWSWASSNDESRSIDRALNAAYNFFNAAGLVQEGREAIEQALAGFQDDIQGSLISARLLAKQARFFNVQGLYEQAIQAAQSAAQHLPPVVHTGTEQEQIVAAEAWLQWGRAALHQGQYEEAEGQLEEALGMARASGDLRLEAEVHLNLGTIHNFQNAFAAAKSHDREALRLARSCGDRYSEGMALNNLGAVADFQGDYESAATYFQEALEIFDSVGYQRGSANALSNLGAVEAWRGELIRALEYHEQAQQVAHALGDIDGEAWALMALGAVLTHLGRWDEARAHLQGALELNDRDGTRTVEAWCLHHLSQVALETGSLEEAVDLAGRASLLAEELGDELTVAGALVVEGEVAVRRGALAQAEDLYTQALSINRRLEHPSGQMRVLACLARLALARQDPTTSRVLAEEALDLDAAATLALDRAPLLAVCGQSLVELGEMAQAEAMLQQALALYQKMGQEHLAAAVADALADLNE